MNCNISFVVKSDIVQSVCLVTCNARSFLLCYCQRLFCIFQVNKYNKKEPITPKLALLSKVNRKCQSMKERKGTWLFVLL